MKELKTNNLEIEKEMFKKIKYCHKNNTILKFLRRFI